MHVKLANYAVDLGRKFTSEPDASLLVPCDCIVQLPARDAPKEDRGHFE